MVQQNNIFNCLKYGLLFGIAYTIIYSLVNSSATIDHIGFYDTNVGLSISLSISSVIVFSELVQNKSVSANVLRILLLVILMTIMIFTKSRVSIIGTCIGCLVFCNNRYKIYLVLFSVLIISSICLTTTKINSTKGRYFIYKTAISMMDTPNAIIKGRGINGFRETYMTYQAENLENAADDQKQLADNILYPLNEYLRYAINYGIARCALVILIFLYIMSKSKFTDRSRSLFVTIFPFTLFSYPFNYPITWIILSFIVADLQLKSCSERGKTSKFIRMSLIVSSIFLLITSFTQVKYQLKWRNATNLDILGKHEEAEQEFIYLSKTGFMPSEFYYNYATHLMTANECNNAHKMLNKCAIIDYNTQLLRAQIYAKQEEYDKAISSYMYAHKMCPNRFIPLFEIYKISDETNRKFLKLEMRDRILSKKIKINSTKINYIINYVK
jgi:hypothetical protein